MAIDNIIIYHNPRCSKSRLCVNEFEGLQKPFTIRNIINDKLSLNELQNIFEKMNVSISEMLRKNEVEYKELIQGKDLDNERIFEIMIENPKLIQRPIVEYKDKAVIARPIENINELNLD